MNVEWIVLILGVLLLAVVLCSKLAEKVGVMSLALFLMYVARPLSTTLSLLPPRS